MSVGRYLASLRIFDSSASADASSVTSFSWWKGKWLNKPHGRKILQWQREFGVVSFGKQILGWVLDYIANQKQHHATGTALKRLESTESDNELDPEA